MKKVYALILSLALCLATFAGCSSNTPSKNSPAPEDSSQIQQGSPQEVYELNVNFSHPEASAVVQVEMMDKIAELSGGRLKFNYYYSNSLVGVSEIVKALDDGYVDISSVPMLMFPDQLVYSGQIISMPLLGIDNVADATYCFGDILEEFPCVKEEIEGLGMKLIAWYAMNGYQLHYTHPTTCRVPSDLSGQKILCDITMVTKLLAQQGAAVTAAPSSEMYSHLEKGVGEAIFLNYTNIKNYGLNELIDCTLEFGSGGINYNIFLICMAEDTWDKLPADLQQLFVDVQQEWLEKEIQRNIDQEDAARAALDAQDGYERINLTEEELSIWEEAIMPMHDEYIEELESKGYSEAKAIYNYISERFSKLGG